MYMNIIYAAFSFQTSKHIIINVKVNNETVKWRISSSRTIYFR